MTYFQSGEYRKESNMESVHEETYRGLKIEIIPDDGHGCHPRQDCDNFTTMVCFHRRYDLGDKHEYTPESLREYFRDEKELVAIPLYISYRSGKNNFRVVLFGLAFYFFNMIIVSQIISSGPNMMAERYSYICYFGIFFPAAFIFKVLEKGELVKRIATVILSLYMVLFSIRCYGRTYVWHNSETLWSEVIKQYPHRVIKAYNNLGNYYFENRDLDKAYANYKEAIDLRTEDPQVYCNMGSLLGAKQQYKLSLNYYNVALKLDSNDALTYLDRGITYSAMGNYALAIKDYRRSSVINVFECASV